jgi:arylsulfatase A-like enzyme
VPDDAYGDGRLAASAVTALQRLKARNQPFFLAVGFEKPHLPFNAPAKYWDQYRPEDLPPLTNNFPIRGAPWYAVGRSVEFRGFDDTPRGVVPNDLAATLRHGYFACISYVDAQVGKVMAELERLGLAEDTIVIVWGDHGFKLGEHTGWGKSSNVEEDIRVPLIIRAPRQPHPGARTAALVEIVDVYPTLLELAGFEPAAGLEGISAKPLFSDPRRPWKLAAFSQYPRNTREDELAAGKWDLMGYTLRTERYRFTRWSKVAAPAEYDALELYDHTTDPAENENLAGRPEYSAVVRDLSARLISGWKAALPPAAGSP